MLVNGDRASSRPGAATSLLDALREHLELTGSKKGCDQGTCGACTVWVDGRRVLACLTLAVACEGHEVTTIEGIGADGEPHPMQRAFVEHDAFQCGYCTPGQIMSASRADRRGQRVDRRGDRRVHERQHLSLRGLSKHSRGDSRGARCDRLAMPARATSTSAVTLVAGDSGSGFLAGGTTKVDLLRLGVERTDRLVDINDLPLTAVEELADGTIRIGALARMSDVARTPIIKERFPAVSEALLLGASEQLRNMASMGGNLCQRVRCTYFRDGVSPCNKREPGTGCSALEGLNRGHAILGVSESCIATHPSDVAVPFVAFDAVVHTAGLDGERTIPIDDFYLLPGDTPQIEHPLAHGELITAIDLPPVSAGGRIALPQVPRSAVVRVRPGLRLRRTRRQRRRRRRCARGARRCRHQAVAGAPRRSRSCGVPRRAMTSFARAAAAELSVADAAPR